MDFQADLLSQESQGLMEGRIKRQRCQSSQETADGVFPFFRRSGMGLDTLGRHFQTFWDHFPPDFGIFFPVFFQQPNPFRRFTPKDGRSQRRHHVKS